MMSTSLILYYIYRTHMYYDLLQTLAEAELNGQVKKEKKLARIVSILSPGALDLIGLTSNDERASA
jgi:hypothetical protein